MKASQYSRLISKTPASPPAAEDRSQSKLVDQGRNLEDIIIMYLKLEINSLAN